MKTSLPTKDTPHEVTLAQRTLAVQELHAKGTIENGSGSSEEFF